MEKNWGKAVGGREEETSSVLKKWRKGVKRGEKRGAEGEQQ